MRWLPFHNQTMTLFFRTTRFDTQSEKSGEGFYGVDAARWLSGELNGWQTSVEQEDWGWGVSAVRGEHAYILAIYDHDTDDVTANGPRWCLRLNNLKDRSVPWYKKIFRNVPPKASAEVVSEIQSILGRQSDFHDIEEEEQG